MKQGPEIAPERAGGALTLEEEKHLELAEHHRVLAARSREEHLQKLENASEEASEQAPEACKVLERAGGAATLAEETHLTLAKVHRVLAAKSRERHLRELGAATDKVREAHRSEHRALRDLSEHLNGASHEVYEDKATMLMALAVVGHCLEHCALELRSDVEVVLAALQSFEQALQFAHRNAKANRDLVLKAVEVHGGNLAHASQELQGDREVVLAAVKSMPKALKYASEALRNDRDLVFAALKAQTKATVCATGENALQFAAQDFWSDREMVLEAIRVEGFAMGEASLQLRQDKDFLLQALRLCPMEDRRACFGQADRKKHYKSLDEALQAADSVLAMPGDDAPLLAIEMIQAEGPQPEPGRQAKKQFSSCQVVLPSGARFACDLRDASSSEGTGTCRGLANRPVALTVGRLAKLVHAEIPDHAQADLEPLPERIFLAFVKPATPRTAPACDLTFVTPWDWLAPVAKFA